MREMKNNVIFFSGGTASFAVADWVKTNFPNDNTVLYFTDTKWEDKDLYRFINEASNKLELPMLCHSMGLNPIELMFEKKLVFNSRLGECSKILKMKVASDFLKKGLEPEHSYWVNKRFLKNEDFRTNAKLFFGIGFEELHREEPIRRNWAPQFQVEMPMVYNIIHKDEALKKYNLRIPDMYLRGFTHNNCAGRCIKAGQAHFKNLKRERPEEFKKLVEQEHHMRICVDAYRYIKAIPEDEITEDEREMLYQEIDEAYRDYFYGRSDKPKFYVSPSASAAPKHMTFKTYSFMKKSNPDYEPPIFDDEGKIIVEAVGNKSIPYPLNRFNVDLREEERQIDLFDFGGCGCFLDYDNVEV
jgi:hypothetical protein